VPGVQSAGRGVGVGWWGDGMRSEVG